MPLLENKRALVDLLSLNAAAPTTTKLIDIQLETARVAIRFA